MTDEPSVILSLDAESPASSTTRATRPSLIVRCREGELDVYVSSGMVLRGDDATPLRIRWGTAAPQQAWWNLSTDYTAAFAREPRRFLDQLLATPDVRVEVQLSDAGPVVITFDARGLTEHMEQLNAACPIESEHEGEESDTALSLIVPSADQVFMEDVVQERPERLSGPRLTYPDLLREANVQGRVLVQAIIDTSGRVEPPSVKVIQSPNPGFDQAAKNYVLRSLFRPARVHGRPVRVLVNVPVDFRIKH